MASVSTGASLGMVGNGLLADFADLVGMVKRSEQPCVGQWCLPGGFIEMGETAREGALREFKEETGLEGKILRVIDVATRVDGYWGDVVLIGFEVEATGGTLNAMDDAEEARYFPLNDMPPIAFSTHQRMLDVIVSEIMTRS